MANYVLLGNLNAEWATKQKQRTSAARRAPRALRADNRFRGFAAGRANHVGEGGCAARAKAKELGISILSVHYTQGAYDFVDIVEAPSPEAAMAFSIWYAAKGYGRVTTLPAFSEASFNAALAKV